MTQKAIIFDSSTLISMSMNGLFDELRNLKKIFGGSFFITQDVKREIIDKPLTIKKFELEALKLKELLEEGVLEIPSALGVNEKDLYKDIEKLKNIANTTYKSKRNDIYIIDSGETSCLVLSKALTEKGIKNVVAVDERTIRMLCEKPDNLKKLLAKKLHTPISALDENFKYFKGFKFIRSSELLYVSYKKGLVKLKGPMVLDALLYAVKFKGCAISDDEIKEIEKIRGY
ncbi:MAG: hypothetical protein AABW51_01335 [Nanoarchaeota archaeon]